MNRIWNSIVGKLWATILLLVSFVLFIVTALLLEFLDNFHTQQAEDSLRRDATTIGKIVVDHENESSMELIIEDILGDETDAMIVDADGKITYSFQQGVNKEQIESKILSDTIFLLNKMGDTPVVKEMILPSIEDNSVMEQYLVLAYPFEHEQKRAGSVIIYQSLEAVHKATKETTNIVFLSAFIAFILTTVFASFSRPCT